MSVFSKIAKHYPEEHGAPNAMMFHVPERILDNAFGEPFKFCSPASPLSATTYLYSQTFGFEDYHWVLTQDTINRSKLLRNEVSDHPIRIAKVGKTIFVLDGHHRYMHAKYFKKEKGIQAFGHEALIK